MIAVADTGPLNYLILIGHIEILAKIYERIFIPVAVAREMQHPDTPEAVAGWIQDPPAWAERRSARTSHGTSGGPLGPGELEAIALAAELKSDYLLMDETNGRVEASRRGLPIIGTSAFLLGLIAPVFSICQKRSKR